MEKLQENPGEMVNTRHYPSNNYICSSTAHTNFPAVVRGTRLSTFLPEKGHFCAAFSDHHNSINYSNVQKSKRKDILYHPHCSRLFFVHNRRTRSVCLTKQYLTCEWVRMRNKKQTGQRMRLHAVTLAMPHVSQHPRTVNAVVHMMLRHASVRQLRTGQDRICSIVWATECERYE